MTDPKLVVADEPTGDLDSVKSREILDLLESLQQGLKKTILLVTHDPTAAARARRLLRIDKGVIVEDRCLLPAVRYPLSTNGEQRTADSGQRTTGSG